MVIPRLYTADDGTVRVAFFRSIDGELIATFGGQNWLYVRQDANDPCRSAYLPSSKSTMGLARIERAKPLFVQTLDVVGSFYYGSAYRRSYAHSGAARAPRRRSG